MTPRAAFFAGTREVSPLLLGIAPFGMVAGVAAVAADMTALQAVGMSVIIFAGASQLAAIELVGQGSNALVIVGTVLVINLRMTMYSASIAPYFQELSDRWKWSLSYLLTDQAYAVSIRRFTEGVTEHGRWYFLGAGGALWVTWQVATVAGIVLGARVPPEWGLDFAVPLTFLAILVPTLRDRPAVAAAAAAAILAVAGDGLPFNLGLIVAAAFGIVGGLVTERVTVR